MDSAQAVALSAELEDGLGCKLPSTLLFDYPTLEALMNYLNKKLFAPEISKSFEGSHNTQDESEANLTNLDELSENEIGALLDEKLANIEES
jgi:myxalamid-type polyketide synthase MxaB